MMIKYVSEILDEFGFLWDIGYEIREGMLDRDYPFVLEFSSRRFQREIRAGLYFHFVDDKNSNFRSVSLTNTRGLFGRFVGEGFASVDLAVFSKKCSTRVEAENRLSSLQSRVNIVKANCVDEMLGKRQGGAPVLGCEVGDVRFTFRNLTFFSH